MIAFPGRVGMEIDGDWWKWWDEMHSHSAFHWCHNHQLFIINLTLSILNSHSQASLSLSILNLIVTLIVPTVASPPATDFFLGPSLTPLVRVSLSLRLRLSLLLSHLLSFSFLLSLSLSPTFSLLLWRHGWWSIQLIISLSSKFTTCHHCHWQHLQQTPLSGRLVAFSPWLAYTVKQCRRALKFNSLSNFHPTKFLTFAYFFIFLNIGLLLYWNCCLCFQYGKSPKALLPARVYAH